MNSGQSFRWNEIENNQYLGVVEDQIILLTQCPSGSQVSYTVHTSSVLNESKVHEKLIDYFHLDHNLKNYYDKWSAMDDVFKNRVAKNENLSG